MDEGFENPPPTAETVARRALVMATVSCRGFVDGDQGNPTGAQGLAERAQDWLRSLQLDSEMSAWERAILESPFGCLSDRDRINATWLSEALTILAWALGRIDLPGYEHQCDAAAVANALGFLQPKDDTVLNACRLRTLATLREYNEFVYNLHWRLRDFSLNHRAYDFRSLASKAWGEPIIRHGLVLVGDDLAVGGVAISSSDEKAWRTVMSVTRERHRASNWLIGYASKDFYEVTTDT